VHFDGDRLVVPRTALEHPGFRQWVTAPDFPEKVRATFVDGEVFLEMSPDPIESHHKVILAIIETLRQCVRDGDLGELYAERVLLTNQDAALSTEPDVLFASWDTLQSGRLGLVEKTRRHDEYVELEGTPDVVVEVVSDSSVSKDKKRLRRAYFMAGVSEYWLIDARDESIRFEILGRGEGDYLARSPAGGAQASAVFGKSFVLRRERNRIGSFWYDLDAISANL
jgi:Uma2 family endonuclease